MGEYHPSLVHFPIALAGLWWLVDLVGLLAKRREIAWVALGLLALALISALAGTVSGQAAYDAALAAGHEAATLDVHADDAGLVPWLLMLVLLLRTAGVAKLGAGARVAAIAAGFGLALFVLGVGRSGGGLVYRHGVGVAKEAR